MFAKTIIGWREWAKLPQLRISSLKVKVDSGAATSALHAKRIRYFRKAGKPYVEFTVNPSQKSGGREILCRTELIGKRKVKSSSGHASLRPLIRTEVQLGGERWPIEITLVDRDVMGFRMLLGRQAIRRRYLIDVGRSFVSGKPQK